MNKISSYIGFAIKANKFISGQTPLKYTKERLHLVLVCSSASDNLKDLARNIANKQQCALIITRVNLSELIHRENIKICGITDENLSKAIINNKEIISIG